MALIATQNDRFFMSKTRNPPWHYDEIILALDFYFEHRPRIPEKYSEEIRDLSEMLRSLSVRLGNEVTSDYRNSNGVYMKLMNFKSVDPDYQGAGLASASAKDREVFETYAGDQPQLHETANAIRDGIRSKEPLLPEDQPGDDAVVEGRLLTRTHRSRERNASIVKRRKDAALKTTGKLACEACGFNFEEVYGKHGQGFIECHHTVPLSQLRPDQPTKLSDLILLCSNCHRMSHRGKQWLSLEKLRSHLIRAAGSTNLKD